MKYLIGNLKMNFTLKDYKGYLKQLNKIAKNSNNMVGVCVPYPYLHICKKQAKNVVFGAQNCHYKPSGAYTGEVSIDMLTDFGVETCIIGHSERRAYYNENNEDINKKLVALLNANIKPILCFGETLEEKTANKTRKVIKSQLVKALKDVQNINNIIFAYEPVWAIGTGLTPTEKEIKQIAKFIKETIYKITNCENIVLLYGGSLNDKNYNQILSLPNVDGGLIGGACLNLEKFSKIISYKD